MLTPMPVPLSTLEYILLVARESLYGDAILHLTTITATSATFKGKRPFDMMIYGDVDKEEAQVAKCGFVAFASLV